MTKAKERIKQTEIQQIENDRKTIWQFLIKSNIYLPHDREIPPLCIYSRKTKIYVRTKNYSQMFLVVLFIIVPNWKQLKYPSIGEWIKKLIHPYNGILVRKKEGIKQETR